MVLGEHAADDVLVDLDDECARDDPRDPWAAESRITRREFDDRPDEGCAWTLWARLPRMWACREEAAIFAADQRRMKSQEGRGADGNGELADASGTKEQGESPQRSRSLRVRLGARWRPRRSTSSCCFSARFSAITARTPPGPHSFAVTTARCNSVRRKFVTCEAG